MVRIAKYIIGFLLISIRTIEGTFGQGPVFVVKSVNFNSSVSNDIAPVLTKDGIIFCSDRKTNSFSGTTTFNDESLYNIYFVDWKDTASMKRPPEIKSNSNTILYYGPLCLAPDGKTVYFTSSILSGKAARIKNITNPRGIFIGELSGSMIINVKPFEYNNRRYSVAQPSISKDGRYLFFASDMPNGTGGSDIYYCELINNKWSAPINLGNKVNSISKENYPYMHSSGRLYFSSDRSGGLGGMDIYYTVLNFGKWEDPVHLPPQINSASDDFAFVAAEDLQTGYFASNRDRKNDDIFSFSSNIIRKVKCDTLQLNNYCYEFYDENAVKFDTIPFKYLWDFGDGNKAEGVRVVHCFNGPGKYVVRFDVVNLLTNEVRKNEKTWDMELKEIEQPYISGPAICNTGRQVKLNADSTNLSGWNITQYYWNFGDETVATGKEVSKVFLKPGSYDIQLIVTGASAAGGGIREACVFKNINVIR
jgi:PKD repeat protein